MNEENIFLVGNDSINDAIQCFEQKEDDETFQRVLISILQRMREDGHFLVPFGIQNDNKLMFHTVMDDNGNELNAAFTTHEDAMEAPKSELLSFPIADMLENALTSEYEGIILNPWSSSIVLDKELIHFLLDDCQDIDDERKVFVVHGEPDDLCNFSPPKDNLASDTVEMLNFYIDAVSFARDHHLDCIQLPMLLVKNEDIEETAEYAVNILYHQLDRYPDLNLKIYLCSVDEGRYFEYQAKNAYENASRAAMRHRLEQMWSTRTIATAEDWKHMPMPECCVKFQIQRTLSESDVDILLFGNIPACEKDLWFWYVQDGVLSIHRSETGYCYYLVDLCSEPYELKVTINHDMAQHPWVDLEEEIRTINHLLDCFVEPEYDYNKLWLEENSHDS